MYSLPPQHRQILIGNAHALAMQANTLLASCSNDLNIHRNYIDVPSLFYERLVAMDSQDLTPRKQRRNLPLRIPWLSSTTRAACGCRGEICPEIDTGGVTVFEGAFVVIFQQQPNNRSCIYTLNPPKNHEICGILTHTARPFNSRCLRRSVPGMY